MVCVQLPDPEVLRRSPPDARTVASLAPGLLSGLPGERFSLRSEGDDFVVRLRHPTGAAPAIRRAPAGGAATDGAATDGAATGGVATDGVATDVTATGGAATDGAATDGAPPEARLPDPGSC
ncbi:MAG TPA: hypothetical protein VLL48_10455, partial [Longimicrobiales bacterium]|nr:hypothetical protein [Longimicrobiales bacterium]